MKLLLAPDTSDFTNWGCRVMGAWFLRTLAENRASPSWMAPSAWFISRHPSLPNLGTLADIQRHAGEVQSGRILQDIAGILRQCEVVVLNGENYLRSGAYKGRMLLFLAYLATKVYGKPCILMNHSAELDEPALAEIAAEVYPLLEEVHFRDDHSAESCASLVRPGRWKVIPDVAFAVPAAPISDWGDMGRRLGQFSAWPDLAEGFDPTRPYVTVCASSIFGQPQHQHLDGAPAFTRLCRRLNEKVGPVVLTAPCESDSAIMRKVQKSTGFPLIGINLPVRQAIDIVGNATVHVGGRWHPGIFAATGGTPTVALGANSHKMHSLMRMLGMDRPVFDALQLDAHLDAIVDQAESLRAAGAPLRQRLVKRSRELGAQVDRNLDWLRAMQAGA